MIPYAASLLKGELRSPRVMPSLFASSFDVRPFGQPPNTSTMRFVNELIDGASRLIAADGGSAYAEWRSIPSPSVSIHKKILEVRCRMLATFVTDFRLPRCVLRLRLENRCAQLDCRRFLAYHPPALARRRLCRQSHAKRRERLEQGAKFRVGSGVATISSMHMPSSASAGRSARSRSSSAAHRPSPGQPRAHAPRFERSERDKDVRRGQAR